MNPLKCVIIDDEPLARDGLSDHIAKVEFLKLEATGSNPLDLSQVLAERLIDLILLDVQMPVMNGIEFLRIQARRPMVILTTAYPQYALESYQLDVLDYLVKPVTFDRFFKAVSKARDYHRLINSAAFSPAIQQGVIPTNPQDYIFIKSDYRLEKIFFYDILFIEGLQNYVSIQTTDKKYITLLSLKQLEESLPGEQFIRVHKSFIVAINKVVSIEPASLSIGASQIPIGRLYRKETAEKIITGKLIRRE